MYLQNGFFSNEKCLVESIKRCVSPLGPQPLFLATHYHEAQNTRPLKRPCVSAAPRDSYHVSAAPLSPCAQVLLHKYSTTLYLRLQLDVLRCWKQSNVFSRITHPVGFIGCTFYFLDADKKRKYDKNDEKL